jgi:hypothetical protein
MLELRHTVVAVLIVSTELLSISAQAVTINDIGSAGT